MFRCLLFLVVSALSCVAGEAVDFPVGINMGYRQLSSAYYNSHNELIHVVTINSSQGWQDYYLATWTDRKNPVEPWDPDTVAMFTRTLETIQNATETVLDKSIEYRSVTVPSHFEEKTSIGILARAAYDLHFFADGQSYQVLTLPDAARLAYDLDSCEGLNLPLDCDPEQEDNFVVVVEFSSLDVVLHFLTVGKYLCYPEGSGSRRLIEYGEDVNHGLNNPTSKTSETLAAAIRSFVDETVTFLIDANIPAPASKIQGIVLVGDASMEGMNDLKHVISTVLPEYESKFLFNLDPGLLGVIGAAHRARQYVTEHAILNPLDMFAHSEL